MNIKHEDQLDGTDIVNLTLRHMLQPRPEGEAAPDLWEAESMDEAQPSQALQPRRREAGTQTLIRFFTPTELRDYEPSPDEVLVGDCHIMRGTACLLGGDPGVGKSRASVELAVAGATGASWFGLPVHRKFRTMIIQNENGRRRLHDEFAHLPCDILHDWIRVSEPPPFGLALGDPAFVEDIRLAMDEFRPDLVIIDPWNAVARDDKQRDYAEAFDRLMGMLPKESEARPALFIVAHTRKPQANEKRTGGTGLMHVLAGSHVITSVPRCVFVMTRASSDETDDRVLFFNPKNNNGRLVPRTAWHRTDRGYVASEDFDWEGFERDAGEGRKIVTLEHLCEVFESCDTMELSDAVESLAKVCGITEKSAYIYFSEKGKFADRFTRNGRQLTFKE